MGLISVLYLWVQNKIVEMEKLKRAYCYLFYKFYKMSEAAPSRWLSHWKASLAVDTLLFFLIFSLLIYYKVFVNKYTNVGGETRIIWILGVFILIPNYFIFHHRDQWKGMVAQFDRLPKERNRRWGLVVWLIVTVVILNLIFSFFLMSQIDWSQYQYR